MKNKIEKDFDKFYLTHIVDNGDGCSVLPEEDYLSFLFSCLKEQAEDIKKELLITKYIDEEGAEVIGTYAITDVINEYKYE